MDTKLQHILIESVSASLSTANAIPGTGLMFAFLGGPGNVLWTGASSVGSFPGHVRFGRDKGKPPTSLECPCLEMP